MEVFKKIVDLTHQIYQGMPSYPTLPGFKVENIKFALRDLSTVNMIERMHTHTGTHVDAPLHHLADGRSVDGYRLEDYMGEGIAVDLTGKQAGEAICREDLTRFDDLITTQCVIFLYTGWSDKRGLNSPYLFKWPHLHESAAEYLVEKKVKAVGIDGLSVGGWAGNVPAQGPLAKSPPHLVHRILLEAEIILIEEVANLDQVLQGKPVAKAFFVFAPIPLKGLEAAPCRAFALIYE